MKVEPQITSCQQFAGNELPVQSQKPHCKLTEEQTSDEAEVLLKILTYETEYD